MDLTSPDKCGTMTPTTSGNATARGSTGEAGHSILFGNVDVKQNVFECSDDSQQEYILEQSSELELE
jgi:hypothetical protein